MRLCRAGLFPLRRGMMAGLSPVPLPFFMHSPRMRLYALMPRGQFLLLLVQKKVVTQRYAPPVSLSKRISKQVIYCISPRESRRRRVPSCNDCRSGASLVEKLQWGRPGVNQGNKARPHCRSGCSTYIYRCPVDLGNRLRYKSELKFCVFY